METIITDLVDTLAFFGAGALMLVCGVVSVFVAIDWINTLTGYDPNDDRYED